MKMESFSIFLNQECHQYNKYKKGRTRLTFIVSDLQTWGRRLSEHYRQTFRLIVFTAEMECSLAIAIQASRICPCSQQSIHHVVLLGYHCQMKGSLRGQVKPKLDKLRQTSVFRSITTNFTLQCPLDAIQ